MNVVCARMHLRFMCMHIHVQLCVCAWYRSAKVGCSQQHRLLMHHLTDCQQGTFQQAPGGKQHLYSNLSRLTESEYYWPKIRDLRSPRTSTWLWGISVKQITDQQVSSTSVFFSFATCNKVDWGQSQLCFFRRKMGAYTLPLNPRSNGPVGLIDVKCLPRHVFSEDGFSNKKQSKRNVCVVCIRDFV